MLYGCRFESYQLLYSVYTNKKLSQPSSLSCVLAVAPTMVRSSVQPKTTRLCSSIRVISLWFIHYTRKQCCQVAEPLQHHCRKKIHAKTLFYFLFEESLNKVSDRSEKILAWLLKACFYPSFSACYWQWNFNVRTVQYPPIGLPLTILFYEMIET